MTMSNFDLNHLAGTPGVTFKRFCSFGCTGEATGDLEIELDYNEVVKVPVCAECASSALDKVNKAMLD